MALNEVFSSLAQVRPPGLTFFTERKRAENLFVTYVQLTIPETEFHKKLPMHLLHGEYKIQFPIFYLLPKSNFEKMLSLLLLPLCFPSADIPHDVHTAFCRYTVPIRNVRHVFLL